jgi:hypothetical protein
MRGVLTGVVSVRPPRQIDAPCHFEVVDSGCPWCESIAKKLSGQYEHRLITGGIGHNLPHEAPEAFVEAVVDVANSYSMPTTARPTLTGGSS